MSPCFGMGLRWLPDLRPPRLRADVPELERTRVLILTPALRAVPALPRGGRAWRRHPIGRWTPARSQAACGRNLPVRRPRGVTHTDRLTSPARRAAWTTTSLRITEH
jgi:hypothetical protein